MDLEYFMSAMIIFLLVNIVHLGDSSLSWNDKEDDINYDRVYKLKNYQGRTLQDETNGKNSQTFHQNEDTHYNFLETEIGNIYGRVRHDSDSLKYGSSQDGETGQSENVKSRHHKKVHKKSHETSRHHRRDPSVSHRQNMQVSQPGTEQNVDNKASGAKRPSWDPFMTYLDYPHFHFSGQFQADYATIPCDVANYDIANFDQTRSLASKFGGKGGWNPNGANDFRLRQCSVTHVCYEDGHCISDEDKDPLYGSFVKEGGMTAPPKIVVLDPQAPLTEEIWGLRLQIGTFFSADVDVSSIQYRWKKRGGQCGPEELNCRGMSYKSVLTNITWLEDNLKSPLIKFIRQVMTDMDTNELSIKLNFDMYEARSDKPNFTWGRITGTIGLHGKKASKVSIVGRVLKSMVPGFYDIPFIVCRKLRKVIADFGNGLPITKRGHFKKKSGQLMIAYPKDAKSKSTCGDWLVYLGLVARSQTGWYNNSAGVQHFPLIGYLTDEQLKRLETTPLLVVEVHGTWPAYSCKRVIFREPADGIQIRPFDSWVFRREAGAPFNVKLIAMKFGFPIQGAIISIEKAPELLLQKRGWPKVGEPELYPQSYNQKTDENGVAEFIIATRDPGSPRKYIDGQVYAYKYYINGTQLHKTANYTDYCFVALVFDNYTYARPANWVDHAYPVLKQYANLYPVMKPFFDIGNYYAVRDNKDNIAAVMKYPINQPGYMPTTRDLSTAKKNMLLDFLDEKNKQPVGSLEKFYNVHYLKELLQTALEIEHATIPPYMTAWFSIRDNYNPEVAIILKRITIQEMLHLTMVANILNSIGGHPLLYTPSFMARYPAQMPGGVQPSLVIPIEKCSIPLIREIFMTIEQPESTFHDFSFRRNIFEVVDKHFSDAKYNHKVRSAQEFGSTYDRNYDETHKNGDKSRKIRSDEAYPTHEFDESFDEHGETYKYHVPVPLIHEKPYCVSPEVLSQYDKPVDKHDHREPYGALNIFHHHQSIGAFYNHILNVLGKLSNCGKNNSIFVGDAKKQIVAPVGFKHNVPFAVHDYFSAVRAVKVIVDQGEGGSPCNPIVYYKDESADLSHYFLLKSIVERHQVKVFLHPDDRKAHQMNVGKVLWDEICHGTYNFTGPEIPFYEKGVWPIISNPRMSKYKKGSRAAILTETFNKEYTKLLKALQRYFNGHPEDLNSIISLMYSLEVAGRRIVRTPIHEDGDSDEGPNAAPSFEFTPED